MVTRAQNYLLVRGIKKIQHSGLKIEVFISDRHVQNRKWIKNFLKPNITLIYGM